MKQLIFFCAFYFVSHTVIAQKSNKAYWKAAGHAHSFYDEANYEEAVIAYEAAFELYRDEEYASHRLKAAASYCMLDQEEGVRRNLFALLPVSTKTDMERVLVNYEIFRKYHDTDWWKELDQKMEERLEALIAHHKNLHYFKLGRNYIYRAIRINTLGDTIANTQIIMKPDGTGWGDPAASSQSQVVYEYLYTDQDSLDHIDELKKIVTTDFWLKTDTTGVIENEKQVWIHPMRNNEFFKTELAPFPAVLFPISKETISEANSKIMIFSNWGTYSSSETHNEYSYLGLEQKSFAGMKEMDCHKFHAIGFNNFHGMSEITYFFNEELGFVEMNYETYDDERISFVLEEIEYTEFYKE